MIRSSHSIILIATTLWALNTLDVQAQSVSGTVTSPLSAPLATVRVTLYNSDTSYFAEERTNGSGFFTFPSVPAGIYELNASRADLAYARVAITTNGIDPLQEDLTLEVDTVMGRWDVLVNSPEPLGGTNLCTLLPDGRLFYCHNTTDPFLFDPATNQPLLIPGAGAVQGCVGLAMRTDSAIVFIGGADQDVYGPGTKFVKTWNSANGSWTAMVPVLDDFRWYPSTTTLPDGRVLTVGGGNENNPERTNTSELLDPFALTTTVVDTIPIGNEQSPIVVLYDGTALMTHRPPQVFDPATELWELTGDFVQGDRMPNGDHADHELVVLPEGNVVAIGYKSFTPGVYGNMVEVYEPTTGTWSLGANTTTVRSRPETVLLPNGKILVLAGEKEDDADPTPTNQYGYTKLSHYYDPYTASWRRLNDMNWFREYHATAVLVPDGRVIVAGGEGSPGNEPAFSVVEAFTPPYLFKGIRPIIAPLADRDLLRGQDITLDFGRTDALTSVILQAQTMVTHMMNCGNNRYVDLPFTQSGTQVTATLPADALVLPNGFYQLTAMVDDIPSVSQLVRVLGDFSTGVVENSMGTNSMRIAPNPALDQVVLTFTSTANAAATLIATDALGKVVLQQTVRLAEGWNTIAVDVHELASGIYQLSLRRANAANSGRLVITGH
ncbi:MAG: galactose oxidase-like domain-containing protein [Flavobacteriales bacterium]